MTKNKQEVITILRKLSAEDRRLTDGQRRFGDKALIHALTIAMVLNAILIFMLINRIR